MFCHDQRRSAPSCRSRTGSGSIRSRDIEKELIFANRGALYEKMKQYVPAIENYTRALALDSSIQAAAAGLSRARQQARMQR